MWRGRGALAIFGETCITNWTRPFAARQCEFRGQFNMRDPTYRVFRKLYGYKPARRFLPASVRDRFRREHKLVSGSVEACRRYQLLPRSAWHRQIYAEIISREDVWSGDTNLEGLNSLPLFDAAAAAGDKAGAKKVAQSILSKLGDSLHRQTWRTIMAARALLVHDDLDICDRLLFELSEEEDPARAQIERVLLTLFHDDAVDLNRQLIEQLVVSDKAPLLVLREWVRRCWLYEGATAAVLDEMLFCAERYKEPEDRLLLLREPLALAFLLDDLSVVKRLLSTYPNLEQSYLYVLPLASYLASTGLSSRVTEKRAGILELARLHTQLDEDGRSLTALLRDQTRSIAIVGNSPCELGSGKGPLIDAHDMVARFNRFSVEGEFARDYGRKCTIHVRHSQDVEVNEDSIASQWTVIDRPDLIYRERKWKNVLALNSSGVQNLSVTDRVPPAPLSSSARRTKCRHNILLAR